MEIADVIVSVLSEKNSFAFYFLTKGGIIKEKFVQHFQKHYIEEDEFFENESGSGPLTNDQLDKIINRKLEILNYYENELQSLYPKLNSQKTLKMLVPCIGLAQYLLRTQMSYLSI